MIERTGSLGNKNESQSALDYPELLESQSTAVRGSGFDVLGYRQTIRSIIEQIQSLYTSDSIPWVIGYSGGKDSTATLQLIWMAISKLPLDARAKPIFVISTDTLVENPIVAAWVSKSLGNMEREASRLALPFQTRMLHPDLRDSFWVNLIGRGYPAPRPRFRWCTERLKIKPSNKFIASVVAANGQAILCLGARIQESAARAKVMAKNQTYRVRDRLSPSATLPGCLVYTPIETWTSDDVWFFLNNESNPWETSNKDLMGLYAGASPDGECPLVVDTSTPSCGSSRFGCWVCTLVEEDKSMTAMIRNDSDKEWMLPLLNLRNALDFRMNKTENPSGSDHHLREIRRMNGAIHLMGDGRNVPGPYKKDARHVWLRRLLTAEVEMRKLGPPEVRSISLISLEELHEIRRIWVNDKHEYEDSLPTIYQEVTGQAFVGTDTLVVGEYGHSELVLLSEICNGDQMQFDMVRELLGIARQQQLFGKRVGFTDRVQNTIEKYYYRDNEDALDRAKMISADHIDIEQLIIDSEQSVLEGNDL
jgi:DNA sulfur modification protein DndC